MDSINIRIAGQQDLPYLLEFEQQLIGAEKPFDPTLRAEKFHYYDLSEIIKNEDSDVFVAEVEGKLIGSGHVRILNAKAFNNFAKYAFLGFMYVDPDFRGRGVNRLIIEEIKQWAIDRGLFELRLQVYDENISAIRAYEKTGFEKILVEMRTDLKAQFQ